MRQTFIDCSGMSRGGKMDKLVEMLTEMDSNHQRTLIFVETKKLADVVAGRLSDEEKMSATSMHGDRSQEQREMALEDFRRGELINYSRTPSHCCCQGNIPSSWPPRSLPGGSTSTTFVMSSTSRCRRRSKNTSTGKRCLTLYISLITPFPSRQEWSDWPCRQHWESH